MKATLCHITEFCNSDFAVSQEDYDTLVLAEGEQVHVLAEATHGYYDIMLPSGQLFQAISRYHLEDFVDVENFNESAIVANLD